MLRKIDFRKGSGTFIYGYFILLLAFIVALACIEQFSKYNNAMKTQMAVDSISDGTAIYMGSDVHSYEEAVAKAEEIGGLIENNSNMTIDYIYIDDNEMYTNNTISVDLVATYNETSNIDDSYGSTSGNGTTFYSINRSAATSYFVFGLPQESGAVVTQKGPQGVVRTANNQIGITESPPNSDNVIFNTDYYGHEVFSSPDENGVHYHWCVVFVWWCFNKSGNGEAFYYGSETAGCGAVLSWARSQNLLINPDEAKLGDLVLLGNYPGDIRHIEIVVSKNSDGSYTTIGGNTTAEYGSGLESNGGCVAMKTRYTTGSFPITYFIRPEYDKVN